MLSLYVLQRFRRSNYFKLVLFLSMITFLFMFICVLVEYGPIVKSVNKTQTIKFPTNLKEVKKLVSIFNKYKDEHFIYVLVLFSTAYIFKQSFAIPGSFLLNIMAGAIFGVLKGFLLVSLLTSLGATNCFLMSGFFGKELVERWFPERLEQLRNSVSRRQSEELFFYLLSMRLFPASPNWLLNLTLPIIHIPIPLFIITLVIGLAPYNFLSVQTGSILSDLNSTSFFTPSLFFKLSSVALLALLPPYLIRQYSVYKHYDSSTNVALGDNEPTHISSSGVADQDAI